MVPTQLIKITVCIDHTRINFIKLYNLYTTKTDSRFIFVCGEQMIDDGRSTKIFERVFFLGSDL